MEEKKLVCPICGEPTSVYMGNAKTDYAESMAKWLKTEKLFNA